MNSIYDFVRAALPWVAMGLLLAIFFVRSAVKKKKGKKWNRRHMSWYVFRHCTRRGDME